MSQIVGTIRQRGQLTIPDKVRENRQWVSDGSAVVIDNSDPQKIIIQPYSKKKDIDWEEFWEDIRRVRASKGEYKGGLSKFIAWDRQTRR